MSKASSQSVPESEPQQTTETVVGVVVTVHGEPPAGPDINESGQAELARRETEAVQAMAAPEAAPAS